jgi:hypothetical protein
MTREKVAFGAVCVSLKSTIERSIHGKGNLIKFIPKASAKAAYDRHGLRVRVIVKNDANNFGKARLKARSSWNNNRKIGLGIGSRREIPPVAM